MVDDGWWVVGGGWRGIGVPEGAGAGGWVLGGEGVGGGRGGQLCDPWAKGALVPCCRAVWASRQTAASEPAPRRAVAPWRKLEPWPSLRIWSAVFL